MSVEMERRDVALPLKDGYEQSSPQEEGVKTKQYIAAICVSIGALTAGSVLSWTSPVSLALKDGNSTILDHPLDDEEVGWVGSLLALGAIIGAYPTGLVCDAIGRKWTILGLGIPFIISWIMIVAGSNVGVLYAARIIAGIATGGSCMAIPMYMGEIAENSIRGALGSFFQLFLTIGILFSYAIGSVVDYNWLGILSGIIPVIFVILTFFMPESPYYLVKKDKLEEAKTALTFFRGPAYDVLREANQLKDEIDEANRNKATCSDIFTTQANRNALIVGLALMLFQQLSGVNAVIFYTSDIFKAAGSTLDANVCSIIVGIVQVVVTYVATVLVDRAGRRILLLMSSAVMATCLIVLGVYFHLKAGDESSVANINWLPLLSVNLFVVFFSLGFGPVPWMMMSELFAPAIKSQAAGIAVTLNWTLAFIVTKTFSTLVSGIGEAATFWICASITTVGFVFTFFRVPETKGKSFSEIQRELGGR